MTEVCVRVAVRIRPLLPKEVLHNHQVCVRVVPGSPQVMLGSDRLFCFDHAFGSTVTQDEVYESCVLPLVESLIDGYNATVFCYGQTGSGKTYTLGGGNLAEDGGIIDRVAHDVFVLLAKATQSSDVAKATVRVSYMELYREELRDLLELPTTHKELHIREDDRGNTVVVGAKEVTVSSAEELLSVLEMGNALRHTGTTGMNEKSSRSHAILTLQLFQCFHDNTSFLKSVPSSKLCLVDLAGSERAGKIGNTGTRLKESVYINTGLLALGNVIRALSDPGRNRRGNNSNSTHIPYRDAKITRLLRDALGGTSHTLMVACISPSHHSVAETLSVLQFASKARHIRNCPGTASTHTEVRSCPPTWDPSDARLGELVHEAQTLRELLKEKEKELRKEREKTKGRVGEEDNFKEPNQDNWLTHHHATANHEELSDYCLLAQEAAVLLGDIYGSAQNKDFRQQLQDWQERLKAVNNSHQSNNKDYLEKEGDQPNHVTVLKLRQELTEYQEALAIDEQVLQQKDTELRDLQKEAHKLIQENKTHIQALKEEKQRNHIKTEQLVNQQILIDRLRNELLTLKSATLGTMETCASGNSDKRPHSVPLFRQSCGQQPARKIHSSPPAYSLQRIIAAFKMRGQVLLAEIDEKDEVYCPFVKQQMESKDNNQEEEEQDDDDMGEVGFRRSLNRTWTSEQRKLFQTKASTRQDERSNGIWSKQQSHGVSGNKDGIAKPCDVSKAQMRSDTVTQRRIQELSVNMRKKEELIKELEKTDKESQAVDRHGSQITDGRAAGLLVEISLQSQRVRAEVYRSLQHMRLQRAELQNSLKQERDASHNTLLDQQEGKKLENKGCHQEEEKEPEGRWLEEEEERVLQRRAQLQELEEELRRREEVLLQKEAYMQQKNKLEMKKLHSSQALSQDLLRVSLQLETLQEQMQNSSSSSSSEKPNRGFTVEELERERDKLKKRRDALDAQLKDNKVLTVEEEHYLLQLEEALETLDAALDFKTRSIQDKQDKLSITESSSHQLENTEPVHVCNIIRKLKELSPPEVSELFVKYFNKVVCLREEERSLRLQCEELVLHNGEQEVVLGEMEAAVQHLALDADRRLTEQHRDHQKHIQLLLQKLKENATAEKHEVIQDRLQHLEKELFFYKTSSRQLKKKLRELLSDAHQPVNQPSGTQEHSHTFSIQACPSTNEPQMHSEEAQTKTHITTTYTKIHSGPTDKKAHNNEAEIKQTHAPQNPRPSSSSDPPTRKNTTVPSHNQMHTQSHGAAQCGEKSEMTQVRLLLKNLRQIAPSDLQVRGAATRRRQSVVDTSTETILEDSIEMSRNTDK